MLLQHGRCWRTLWRSIWSGSSGADGFWSSVPMPRTSSTAMRCDARLSASARELSKRKYSRIPAARGGRTAASSRLRSSDPKVILDFLKGPDFALAAFKGQRLTLRDWNLQLRQPILLSDGRMIVSVSPQEGFLHQVSELDTLGIDRPESQCRLK